MNTGCRRNTSCDLAREEQEEDRCNKVGFSSKHVAKGREKGRVKRVADNLLLYSCLLWKHAYNEDGIVQSMY